MGGFKTQRVADCLAAQYTPGCTLCHANYIQCFLQDCTCPGSTCAGCIFDICKPGFEACAGAELPVL
ncbi:MAG: hypothetical protein ACI9WU_001847 [Myxococcota bacterium]|jgi:hypothetical protein